MALTQKGEWTRTVAEVREQPLDARMRAQGGRFLVGGLRRQYGGWNITVGGRAIPATELPDIESLTVRFSQRVTDKWWPCHGATIRIPATWKHQLRSMLEAYTGTGGSINRDRMYPPINEIQRLAAFVAVSCLTTI